MKYVPRNEYFELIGKLGIKTVSYEWSKDYYGRQNSDEIKLTYTI